MVSIGQIEALGLSPSAARSRVQAGRLHRVHRGVYAVGRATLDARGRRMAAVLACGPGAVLSHRTAAHVLGLLPSSTAKVELSVPCASARGRPGLRVHRVPGLRPEDVTEMDGIPCTEVARTLLDLAAVVSARTLNNVLEAAERLRIYDGSAVDEQLTRNAGRPEAHRLQAATAAYTGAGLPSRRELERRARELFEQAGLGRPLINTLVDVGDEQFEVDFCWPDRRLVVEADSWEFHGTRAAFERDRRQDQMLKRAGWATVRITWRQVHEAPEEVITAVA